MSDGALNPWGGDRLLIGVEGSLRTAGPCA